MYFFQLSFLHWFGHNFSMFLDRLTSENDCFSLGKTYFSTQPRIPKHTTFQRPWNVILDAFLMFWGLIFIFSSVTFLWLFDQIHTFELFWDLLRLSPSDEIRYRFQHAIFQLFHRCWLHLTSFWRSIFHDFYHFLHTFSDVRIYIVFSIIFAWFWDRLKVENDCFSLRKLCI